MNSNKENTTIAPVYLAKADNAISQMTGVSGSRTARAIGVASGAASGASERAGQTAEKIGDISTQVQGIAEGLLPGAERVSGDAAHVRQIGDQNLDASKPWLQQSAGLLRMDENAGGMSGEFAKLYKQLDPELQITLAAGDARRETQKQTDSAVRSLQRAGVSPTASALANIRERATASVAALVSAVKTKARQSGVEMQLAALEKGITMAINQSGVGQHFVDAATNDIVHASQMEGVAGQIRSAAAGIYGSSATLLSNAQQLVQAAANGEISAGSLEVSAANSMVQAFATAAEYYSTQASSMRALDEGGSGI